MKLFLSFLLIISSSTLFARELTVLVIDGWKGKPVANCQVKISSPRGSVFGKGTTDSLGIVVFPDAPKGNIEISAISNIEGFKNGLRSIRLNENMLTQVFLPVTTSYAKEESKREDEKYGVVQYDSEVSMSDSTDQDAAFPGGAGEMKKYIQETVQYPQISLELGDQGRVYVVFVVEPNGIITHVDVLRPLTNELDEEAKRIVRSMPNWSPGIVDGKPVRARCTLPITFTLM